MDTQDKAVWFKAWLDKVREYYYASKSEDAKYSFGFIVAALLTALGFILCGVVAGLDP